MRDIRGTMVCRIFCCPVNESTELRKGELWLSLVVLLSCARLEFDSRGFTLDFQSGTIIEQLNQNTHVYQYTMNSMVSAPNKLGERHELMLALDSFGLSVLLRSTQLANKYPDEYQRQLPEYNYI